MGLSVFIARPQMELHWRPLVEEQFGARWEERAVTPGPPSPKTPGSQPVSQGSESLERGAQLGQGEIESPGWQGLCMGNLRRTLNRQHCPIVGMNGFLQESQPESPVRGLLLPLYILLPDKRKEKPNQRARRKGLCL